MRQSYESLCVLERLESYRSPKNCVFWRIHKRAQRAQEAGICEILCFFVHESLPRCATQAVFQLGLDTILIIFTIYSLFFAGRIKLSSITDIVII